jgi:hypothetical protein
MEDARKDRNELLKIPHGLMSGYVSHRKEISEEDVELFLVVLKHRPL